MKCLAIPDNDATQRLEQAFQLMFQSSPHEYRQLCQTFEPLGGLPRAWIIKGESGAGKTYLANVLCQKYQVDYTVTVTIGELAIMYPGDMLKGLRAYLGSIKNNTRAVVILDNIELLFPREDSDFSLVYAFQSWIQELVDLDSQLSINGNITDGSTTQRKRVLVLGLTQEERELDPIVKTLFDDAIEVDIPTPEERSVILRTCAINQGIHVVPAGQITTQPTHPSADDTIPGIERSTNYPKEASRSDLDNLDSIAMKCHGYLAADLNALCIQAGVTAYHHGRTTLDQVQATDFEEAMKSIRVSALRQSTSVQKVEPVYWSNIGGLEGVKKVLEESVIWLYKHAEAYARMGIDPSKGVLLYGPPGTGKTLLAKAVATESEANFMAVSIPDLVKGEVGESEKAIAKVFKTASRCSPCIVFLDELEAIFGMRESSGGLGKQALVRKAGLYALKANRTCIEAQDFFSSTTDVQPSVNQLGLLRYEQFRR
ncbi:spermatogenesis associated protein 5 [Gryganskiella cystojenkinii]|nr:spermatogenesis associated protein 5 [Gryganskiella cystojenkinii]